MKMWVNMSAMTQSYDLGGFLVWWFPNQEPGGRGLPLKGTRRNGTPVGKQPQFFQKNVVVFKGRSCCSGATVLGLETTQ